MSHGSCSGLDTPLAVVVTPLAPCSHSFALSAGGLELHRQWSAPVVTQNLSPRVPSPAPPLTPSSDCQPPAALVLAPLPEAMAVRCGSLASPAGFPGLGPAVRPQVHRPWPQGPGRSVRCALGPGSSRTPVSGASRQRQKTLSASWGGWSATFDSVVTQV